MIKKKKKVIVSMETKFTTKRTHLSVYRKYAKGVKEYFTEQERYLCFLLHVLQVLYTVFSPQVANNG